MSANQQQFKEEMESAWAYIDENFDPELIFGKIGYQFILSHAIRSSTHPLVTGGYVHCGRGAIDQWGQHQDVPGIAHAA